MNLSKYETIIWFDKKLGCDVRNVYKNGKYVRTEYYELENLTWRVK
jgi:hypothetical protein